MIIIRLFVKIVLFPVVLILLLVKGFIRIAAELSSIVLGGQILLVFIFIIYTICIKDWNQLFVPVLIEAGLMTIMIGTAIIEELIDTVLIGITSL